MGKVFKALAIITGGFAAASVVILMCDRLGWQTEHLATLYQLLRATQTRLGTRLFHNY